jgi:hypothetical protein
LVGRIEFRGHHSFSDLTLRRALALQEGESFDLGRLRRSLAALNRLEFLEPMTEDDVQAVRDPDGYRIHLTFAVREKPRGRWLFSGPFGPTNVSGPFHASIGSRLPAWGQGPLELSTYYASFSLFAFLPSPASALVLGPQASLLPLVSVERPYLPGHGWQSGFMFSPQLGWRETLTRYAFAQARGATRRVLEDDSAGADTLAVPLRWKAKPDDPGSVRGRSSGTLVCEAPARRWAWLRAAGRSAVDWLLLSRSL